MAVLRFEWDEAKARANLAKHRVAFDDAQRVFDDPFLAHLPDELIDYGEERVTAIGMVNGVILLVVYTERTSGIRIISARGANRHEQKIYNDERLGRRH